MLIMVMEDISIKRRLNMVRLLREAGASFDEIVAILRLGNQCAEQVNLRKNRLEDMAGKDGQQEMQPL